MVTINDSTLEALAKRIADAVNKGDIEEAVGILKNFILEKRSQKENVSLKSAPRITYVRQES